MQLPQLKLLEMIKFLLDTIIFNPIHILLLASQTAEISHGQLDWFKLTFWNSGGLSFSSRIIILIGTFTKLSFSESPDSLTLSFIDTRNDNVSCVWNRNGMFSLESRLKLKMEIKRSLQKMVKKSYFHSEFLIEKAMKMLWTEAFKKAYESEIYSNGILH